MYTKKKMKSARFPAGDVLLFRQQIENRVAN